MSAVMESAIIENVFIFRPLQSALTKASYRSVVRQPSSQTIDVRDEYQVKHLCRLHGVSALEVCRAVDHVGTDRTAVQKYLRAR